MRSAELWRWLRPALLAVSIFLSMSLLPSCDRSDDPVTLTLASWRTDDVAAMNRIHALFTAAHPNITVELLTYDAVGYDRVMKEQLALGTGADVLWLRGFDKGLELWKNNYLRDITDIIPGLSSYAAMPVKAWSEGEVTYGVPSAGVTHGIYYRKSVFAKYGIAEPATWDDFIAACEKMLAGGETVLAQGAADPWTLNFLVFSGLGPNFYGGEAARQSLMGTGMKLTDAAFVKAFRMVESLKRYMPAGFETLGYEDAREQFALGQAALFIGGSWEISVFKGLGAGSDAIGWFAPPLAAAGNRLQYCFHTDAGIGINKKTTHRAAAEEYIKWVAGTEYAQAFMNELPGFFSYTPGTLSVADPLAQKMYAAAEGADLTVRLMSELLNAGSPSGDSLLDEALAGLLKGIYTPESAAAFVQAGLDSWYK